VDVLVVLALTAVAGLLRLTGLGHESIWYDETCTLEMAGHGYLDMLTGRAYEPSNPAGYYLLLRVWLELLGSHGIETARAFSAVAGTLVVPATWLLARAVGAPRRAAWLACLLVAVSPPLVYLGQEARGYALLETLVTLAVAAVAHIERDDRPLAWAAFALTGAALVHVHYYGFFVLTVLGLELLAWSWRLCRPGAVLRLGVAALVVALAFAHYVPAVLEQIRGGQGRAKGVWWQHLGLMPSFSVVGRTLVWKQHGLGAVLAMLALVVLTVFVPAAWLLRRTRDWPRLLVVFVLGLPLLVSLISLKLPMVSSHYLSVVFPALLLLLAWALDAGLRTRAGALVAVPVVALVVLLPAALVRVYTVHHKTDWRVVAALTAGHAPDLPVYFYEAMGEDPFAYYRPEGQRHGILPRPGANGSGWERAGYLKAMRAEPDGFWLVLYLTSPEAIADESGIVEFLQREYVIERDDPVPPMRVLRLRPRKGEG
jgi:4-amino-4-deoxy-L-arabinose transferase-like glycosyltransferase